MPLEIGTTLGVYEVLSAIGAGGMGEVYKARDTKLDRDVALKILPDAFVNDPERLARFQREAKVLASLNHPNIAQIHGLEESGDSPALVLEYVPGPTLQDRIAKGPIPLDEALPIARQIAEALEAAHEQGIIHRDLKPANVKVKDDGTVKVLDFGLAKALQPDLSDLDAANSPTMTMTAAATKMGVIMGTAAYMSPEQARGKQVDKRADIWAFGVVLFEMLTGNKLFTGDDLTETLASVVKEQPDLGEAPPEVRRLLDTCLQKNPKQRLRDIGDVWALLESAPAAGRDTASAGPGSRLPWLLAAVAAIAAIAVSVQHFGETALPTEITRFQEAPPAGSFTVAVALSPDGRHLALVLDNQVWVRSFDSLEAAPLDGTNGATYPFWSPDSASLGFFADGQLKMIDRTGGLVRTLTAAAVGRGGTWSSNGTIVFSPGAGEQGLFAVALSGGDVRAVTTLSAAGGADAHRYPHFLPDGERFLYLHLTSVADIEGVYVGSLDGTPPVRVLDGGDQAIYAGSSVRGENGYVLFRRSNVLMAQSFDTGSLETVGASFPVVEGVGLGQNTGSGLFSVSAGGSLAYAPDMWMSTGLAWFNRTGERLDDLTGLTGIWNFSVSPDQQNAAISIFEDSDNLDVWLQALSGGAPSRFTFGPRPGWEHPVWAPDGGWVAYSTSGLAGLASYDIRRKPTDMSGAEQTLSSSDAGWIGVWDWAPDGSYLVYEHLGDLQLLPLEGDRAPVPYLETPALETYAQVSPDGRWMAYVSDAQGDQQVYVKSIPATGSLWQISTDGGSMPRWRRDGRELFYRAADGTLTAVDVGANLAREGPAAASFEYVPTPKPLFSGVLSDSYTSRFTYQPSADGQRFALIAPATGADVSITVVLNWFSELQARVATGR